MTPCIVTQRADTERERIFRRLVVLSPGAARKFEHQFEAAVKLLQRYPDIGHKRSDLTKAELYFWNFEQYYLIYRRFKNKTSVAYVLDARTNIQRTLK